MSNVLDLQAFREKRKDKSLANTTSFKYDIEMAEHLNAPTTKGFPLTDEEKARLNELMKDF